MDVEGQEVAVNDAGDGTAAVLLHSSGLSSHQWRRLRDVLKTRHRVLAPDFVGYGQSAPWTRTEPFDHRLDVAVAARVAALAQGPVHLVGHSYGGLIALSTALSGRVPVRSLSLFDPVAFGVLYSANDQAGLANLSAASADPRFTDRGLAGTEEWAELFVNFWNGPGYWTRLPEVQRRAFLSSGRKMTEEVLSLMHDRTGHEAYGRLEVPTLLITGSRSPPAGRRTVEVLGQSMPHARVEVIEGAGHMGPLTHADQVNALIAAHVEAAELR